MYVLLFEMDRAEIAKRGMQTFVIVPNLNVFKDRGAGLGMRGKLAGDAFCFEGAEETFSDGIVITVANPAHAHLEVRVCQAILVSCAGVLAALI